MMLPRLNWFRSEFIKVQEPVTKYDEKRNLCEDAHTTSLAAGWSFIKQTRQTKKKKKEENQQVVRVMP